MINLNNIQELEENEDINCDYNSNIVCPYCGHENEPDGEYDDRDFDEAHETECGECEKHFMVTPAITIDYTSEPIENYYIRQRKHFEKDVAYYQRKVEENKTNENMYECFLIQFNYVQEELEKLNRTFQRYFDDNAE
jgi:hypothetical protein